MFIRVNPAAVSLLLFPYCTLLPSARSLLFLVVFGEREKREMPYLMDDCLSNLHLRWPAELAIHSGTHSNHLHEEIIYFFLWSEQGRDEKGIARVFKFKCT